MKTICWYLNFPIEMLLVLPIFGILTRKLADKDFGVSSYDWEFFNIKSKPSHFPHNFGPLVQTVLKPKSSPGSKLRSE